MSRINSFTAKLHGMLQDADKLGFDDIISWQSEGESFMIHQPERFASIVMQRYFPQTIKYKSFQRQLNVYGFRRVHQGPNKGAYRQRHFKRQNPELSQLIVRKTSRRNHRSLMTQAKMTSNITTLQPKSSEKNGNITKASDVKQSYFHENKIEMGDSELKVLYDIFYPEDAAEQNLIASALSLHEVEETNKNDTMLSSHIDDMMSSFPEDDVTSSIMAEDDGLDSLLSFVEQSSNILDTQEDTVVVQHQAKTQLENNDNKARSSDVATDDDIEDLEHTFPFKLHSMLDDAANGGFDGIISWVEDGTAFKVHNRDAFVDLVMPNYFDQTKYESFRRQLNLYGFIRVGRGERRGVVFHPSFLQGDRNLCRYIERHLPAGKNSTEC